MRRRCWQPRGRRAARDAGVLGGSARRGPSRLCGDLSRQWLFSRTRRARDRPPEHVAHARDASDRTTCAAVQAELLAQVADVRAERVCGTTFGAPHVREQPIRRYDMLRVLHERVEDPELRGREAHDNRAALHLMGLWIEVEVSDGESRLGPLPRSAAGTSEDCADPEGELPKDVRLGYEIVGAELETAERLLAVVRAGHDQNRCLSLGTDLAQELETAQRRETEVDDNEIRPRRSKPPQRLRRVARLDHDEVIATQHVGGDVQLVAVVLDDEDLHLQALPPIRRPAGDIDLASAFRRVYSRLFSRDTSDAGGH